MLVLSAMLAPESSGEAITNRACCDELLAKMPAPHAKIPTRHAMNSDPNAASRLMPSNIERSEIATLDAAPAVVIRRVAHTLPAMPAAPNNTNASDNVFGDGSSSVPINGAM